MDLEHIDFPDVPLDDPDPKYARGASIGCLYGVLTSLPHAAVEWGLPYDSLEMALRIAEATHRPFRLVANADCPTHGATYVFRFDPATE